MHTHIKKIANSLVVRIPSAFSSEMNLKDGTPIDLSVKDNSLVISKIDYDGNLLLSLITQDMNDDLFPDDKPRGLEIW